jgi:hypothetical protein
MPSSGILCRVALARTYVLEKYISSIIRVERVFELGKSLAVTSNQGTLRKNIVFLRSVPHLLVTANVVAGSLIVSTLMIPERRFLKEPYSVLDRSDK